MAEWVKWLGMRTPRVAGQEDFTHKIGLILIAVSLTVILLIITLFSLSSREENLKLMLSNGRSLTKMVTAYSTVGFEKEEGNKVLRIVDFLARKNGLVYGMIVDANGRVVAHTDPDLVDTSFRDPISLQIISSNNPLSHDYEDLETGQKIFEFSRPLFHEGQRVGAVRLGFSQGKRAFLSKADMKVLSVVAILVFIMVPIFYYSMRSSLRPLASLNDELKSVLEQSDFLKIQGDLEGGIGKLVERFTQVVSTMKERYAKLRDSYNDIEVSNRILAYEKDRIASIIDNLNEGVIVTNSSGKIVLVNREVEHLMSISKESVTGKRLEECLPQKEVQSLVARENIKEDLFAERNIEIPMKQSKARHILHISYLPLLSSKEDLLGYIMVAKDITAQKMAEKNQTEFIAHVSHELRTPLTTIKSYIEMLMDDEISEEETRIEFYNTINDETDRVARLIENLLNISKIEMGRMMIERDLLKPHEFMKDIVKSVESQADRKDLKLEMILPEKMDSLYADKDLVRVAILNILSNAIKYTPPGGSVILKVSEEDDHIHIDVTDTGCGISEHEFPHIFEKFYRSSNEEVKKQTGNGLGLALSKEIINLHDGEIEVSSTLGEGSHFVIRLPLDQDPRLKKLQYYGESIKQSPLGKRSQYGRRVGHL